MTLGVMLDSHSRKVVVVLALSTVTTPTRMMITEYECVRAMFTFDFGVRMSGRNPTRCDLLTLILTTLPKNKNYKEKRKRKRKHYDNRKLKYVSQSRDKKKLELEIKQSRNWGNHKLKRRKNKGVGAHYFFFVLTFARSLARRSTSLSIVLIEECTRQTLLAYGSCRRMNEQVMIRQATKVFSRPIIIAPSTHKKKKNNLTIVIIAGQKITLE